MSTKWGNPDTQTFERTNLRQAQYDTQTIRVHRLLWGAIERLLIGFDQAGVDVHGVTELDDPLKRGFKFATPADAELVAGLVEGTAFELVDGVDLIYLGTPEAAEALSAALKPLEAEETPEVPEPEIVASRPRFEPYGRNIEDDPRLVGFVQTLVAAEPTGEFDEQTSEWVKVWQRRHGVEQDGVLDVSFWDTVIPRRPSWLRPGATGSHVKVLQAAFIEHGYMDGPVTGVWGVAMSQALRQFQTDFGIHQRLRIGSPEWSALFGV